MDKLDSQDGLVYIKDEVRPVLWDHLTCEKPRITMKLPDGRDGCCFEAPGERQGTSDREGE